MEQLILILMYVAQVGRRENLVPMKYVATPHILILNVALVRYSQVHQPQTVTVEINISLQLTNAWEVTL